MDTFLILGIPYRAGTDADTHITIGDTESYYLSERQADVCYDVVETSRRKEEED